MAGNLIDPKDIPFGWIKRELTFKNALKKGMKNKRVGFVQESLTLAGHRIVVDDDFGPATHTAVTDFQGLNGLPQNGVVNKATFDKLIEPYLRALSPIDMQGTVSELVVAYARQHLGVHPREAGGQNRGPWVRFYMDGNEGRDWPWCAGFVTFLIKQACKYHNIASPVARTYSCDVLALSAKNKDQFVSEKNVKDSGHPSDVLLPGTIFLNRKSRIDWTHTGVVISAGRDTFATIEGNTNDDGSREGYEVCARTRGYGKKDFVVY